MFTEEIIAERDQAMDPLAQERARWKEGRFTKPERLVIVTAARLCPEYQHLLAQLPAKWIAEEEVESRRERERSAEWQAMKRAFIAERMGFALDV